MQTLYNKYFIKYCEAISRDIILYKLNSLTPRPIENFNSDLVLENSIILHKKAENNFRNFYQYKNMIRV